MVAPQRRGIKSDRDPDAGRGTGLGPTCPSAAARLLTARGSSEETASVGGGLREACGRPKALELVDRVGPRQPRQRRRGREAHPVRTASPGRGRVGRRPQQHLGAVVAVGGRRQRAAHDPDVAGCVRDEAPVVRTRDEVDGEARVRRGQDRVDPGGVGAAARDGEREVGPLEAVEESQLGLAEQRALRRIRPDRGRRGFVDLDQRTAGGGQGAEDRVARGGVAEGRRLTLSRVRPGRPGQAVRPAKRLLDRPLGQARRRLPGRDGIRPRRAGRRRSRARCRRSPGPERRPPRAPGATHPHPAADAAAGRGAWRTSVVSSGTADRPKPTSPRLHPAGPGNGRRGVGGGSGCYDGTRPGPPAGRPDRGEWTPG